MKKTLALILSVLMVLSVMSVMAITSSAEEEATVAAYYGKIENWSGSTFFITGLTTSDNDTVYANLKNGTYTLSVTVIDDTTGTTYYIPQYYFDTPSKEFYATSFLRLAVCEYGIVPVADHTYTVGLEVYEGSTLLYAGVSETGAFATTNEAFQNDGAIVPETVPHECVVVASVNAYYGKIENWSGSTFFIAGLTTFNNDVVYAGLKDGTYTLKVSITDDNTGATYIIPEYAFDTPSKEFYATSFLRLAVCEYGIVPVAENAYTLIMEVYNGDVLVAKCESATGAYVTTNDAFIADGALIPENVPHTYVEPDAPVVEPETPNEPAEATGDAAVYATIAVAVAAVAMAVVLKRKSTI